MSDTSPLRLAEVSRYAQEVLDQVGTVIVGKREQLELVLAGVLAGGHVLLEDYPGLAKTLAARCFAQSLGLGFARLHALRTDEELTGAVGLATSGAAGFVGRERHGLVAGARADVVVLDALNGPDALVRVPPRHLVVAGGQVVVDHGELVDPLAGT